MYIVSSQQQKELDRRTIEEVGIPGAVLMEMAGRHVAEVADEHFDGVDGRVITVVCGKGNNGGDGMVAARHLERLGADVEVFVLSPETGLSEAAQLQARILANLGFRVHFMDNVDDLGALAETLAGSDLVVDAILGTGLSRPAEGMPLEAIKLVNGSRLPVVAVDIPSGLFADHPLHHGASVQAEVTVTFDNPKKGNYFYPSFKDTGVLVVVDIGIPDALKEDMNIQIEELGPQHVAGIINPRDPQAHKGTFGHLLVVAGSRGMTGAAALSCESAGAVGAGLVTLACPASTNDTFEQKLTETMTLPLTEGKGGFLTTKAFRGIQEFSESAGALAVGPGLGGHDETRELVAMILADLASPMVLDADGLNAIAGRLDILKSRWKKHDPARSPVVITPHPGEMARLTGKTISEVQSDRVEAAQALAQEYSLHVVLKGVQTLVVNPNGHVLVNPTGNAGMASGGVGDVLTGVIAGLMVQRISAESAAAIGTYVHGLAGDRVYEKGRVVAVKAGDILAAIPGVVRELIDGQLFT